MLSVLIHTMSNDSILYARTADLLLLLLPLSTVITTHCGVSARSVSEDIVIMKTMLFLRFNYYSTTNTNTNQNSKISTSVLIVLKHLKLVRTLYLGHNIIASRIAFI